MSYSELLIALSKVWDTPIDKLVGLEVSLKSAERTILATPTEEAFAQLWIDTTIDKALEKEFKRGLK